MSHRRPLHRYPHGGEGVHCPRCGKEFGGTFGYDRHVNRRQGGRCRTPAELRARGMAQRADGVWVRAASWWRQLRLFPVPPGRPKLPPQTLRGSPRTPEAVSRAQSYRRAQSRLWEAAA